MTITIDPWQLFGCTVLAAVVLYCAAAVLIMTLWGDSNALVKAFGLALAGALAAGAISLMLAGAGVL